MWCGRFMLCRIGEELQLGGRLSEDPGFKAAAASTAEKVANCTLPSAARPNF